MARLLLERSATPGGASGTASEERRGKRTETGKPLPTSVAEAAAIELEERVTAKVSQAPTTLARAAWAMS